MSLAFAQIVQAAVKRIAAVRLVALVGFAAVLFSAAPERVVAQDASGRRPPNIILIVADDLGWGDLAVYGHPDVSTPNLDALARSGRLLTQFYVASPVCSPSRAAMLTGRFPAEVGIHYAIGGPAGTQYNSTPWLDDAIPTVYDAFGQAGYRVGHFGKWHLGARGPAGDAPPPEAYGVDESLTTNSTGAPLRVSGRRIDTVTGQSIADSQTERGDQRAYSTAAIMDAGMAFIDRADDRPFLLSLWTLEPHSILNPTDEQMEPYLRLTHPTVRDRFRSSQTVYYASLTNIDREVGRLLAHLDARGLRENTVVIFTSDNGPSPLWSVETGHAGAGLAGPFRGAKASLYEGGIRVPFIIAWPETISPGVVDDDTVMSAVDLAQTLTALAGVPLDADSLDGQDQSPALMGRGTGGREHPLFWDYRFGFWGRDVERAPRLAMREGDWKLLMNPDGTRVELYNLSVDLNETANAANYEPERVAAMSASLMDWHRTRSRDPENAPLRPGRPWPMPRAAASPADTE
jgi:arylsulfatase A-like enzyme